jgi:hypothetical protein
MIRGAGLILDGNHILGTKEQITKADVSNV